MKEAMRKKSAKGWIALLSILLCAALAAGCSLAQGDGGVAQDELVGVFVRLLPDGSQDDDFFAYDEQAVEDYLRAHPELFSSGDFTLPDGLGQSMHILTDEEKRGQCIVFETLHDENEDGPYTYRSTSVGAIFNMMKTHITVTDEDESIEASAEVYIDAAFAFNENSLLDINPVYRRPDGMLCVEQGAGFMGIIDGVAKTITAESSSIDAEGNKTKRVMSIEVSAKAEPRVERALIIEMDENNRPIASREIDLARETLVERVSPETAWALVEARVTDKSQGGEPREKIVRKLVDLENGRGETALMLPADQEGMLVLKSLTVAYPGVNLDDDV